MANQNFLSTNAIDAADLTVCALPPGTERVQSAVDESPVLSFGEEGESLVGNREGLMLLRSAVDQLIEQNEAWVPLNAAVEIRFIRLSTSVDPQPDAPLLLKIAGMSILTLILLILASAAIGLIHFIQTFL